MELKFQYVRFALLKIICSNCTFMELKSLKEKEEKEKADSSNCTFMELKLHPHDEVMAQTQVLIVPLWN